MRPSLLIPVKSLADGKSRLKATLDDASRRQLVEALLARVLAAASDCQDIERTAVISECDEALRVAAMHGARAIRQASAAGLNNAASEGVQALRHEGAAAVMIVAADLPLVTTDDLSEIAGVGDEPRLAIWTDKHESGTNAPYVPSAADVQFAFGVDSCAAHQRAAIAAGLGVTIRVNRRIAFDIDTPEDLRRWREELRSA
jgi:2-phospho-L-lactate guanylyltransferase